MKPFCCYLILFIALAATSCAEKIPDTDPIFDDKQPLHTRIRLALEKGYIKELGVDATTAESIKTFYRERGYRPLWANDSLLTETGKTMQQIVTQPSCIGVPTSRWKQKVNNQKELIAKELLMTTQFGYAVKDLKTGFLDTAAKSLKPCSWPDVLVVQTLSKQVDTVKNWGKWFADMGSPHDDYKRIAQGLFSYSFGKSFSEKTFKLPNIKEDSAGCYEQGRLSLIDKGYLPKDAVPDSIFLQALSNFQLDNGLKTDGVIGTYTRKALEESAQAKVDRIVLSLERWRWRERFPERYVWINIPEYVLRIYYNDTLFSMHNVVVGKIDTKTPQLKSRIRTIVSYPYWTIPYSITSKEILPEAKRNPGYFARNHYRVYNKSEEIDPYSVNWKRIRDKTFPYKVIQDPGTHNSLGIIKFEFSNPYGVYVHDTPSKSLFRNDVRSYSHGCIRCQLPDSLARFILRRDEQRMMPPDSLDSMLYRQEHRKIQLKHPIDIQVDYITVTADETNRLTIHPDIYGRDAAYVAWFYPN